MQQILLPIPKSRKFSRLFPPISENWAKYPSSNLMEVTEQELKFSIQDFLIKCDQILQFSPAFVTFMEEIYNESFIRCAVGLSSECFKKCYHLRVIQEKYKGQNFDLQTLHG